MYKVFDIHTHSYPENLAEKAVENLGRFYNFEAEGKGTYEDLERQAGENNVKGFLIFSVTTNPKQVVKVNDGIAETVKLSREHGFETVGFAGLHQDYPDIAGEIERILALGLKGIKIHPDIQGVDIDDPRLFTVYEILQGRYPVYFHMGDDRPAFRFSEAKKLAHVLEMFPKLQVIAAHLGGYLAWEDALYYLAGRENVWYDTSSALWAMSAESAERQIRSLGCERVMFGTDYPAMNTKGELERFFKLRLTERERVDILYNNAARFLHL